MPPRFPFDPWPLDRIATAHTEAWSALLASASAVATLPLRTVQAIVGFPELDAAGPAERLERAEDARRTLASALRAEQLARAEDAERHARALKRADEEAHALREAYGALAAEATDKESQARQDQKLALYRTIEPLLTQLPIVRHAVAQGRTVATDDVLALLAPLDVALAELGFSAIGEVGQTAPFDATLHQMTRGPMPEPDAPVTVKHVGYRLGDQILRRARVAIASE